MTEHVVRPGPLMDGSPDLKPKREEFADYTSRPLVWATRMSASTVLLTLLLGASFGWNVYLQSHVHVVGLFRDDSGYTQAVSYTGKPVPVTEAEEKWSLRTFAYLHYTRRLRSIDEDFANSRLFLDDPIAAREQKALEDGSVLKRLRESGEDELFRWRKTTLRRITDRRSVAMIEYDIETVDRTTGTVVAIQNFTTTADYEFLPVEQVANQPNGEQILHVNPHAMVIMDLRTDASVKTPKGGLK